MKGKLQNSVKEFLGSLTPDVLNEETFINWERINSILSDCKDGIELLEREKWEKLNQEETVEKLSEIISKRPKGVVKSLKLIIGHTPQNISYKNEIVVFNDEIGKIGGLSIENSKRISEKLAKLFIDYGAIDIIKNKRDIQSYIEGVLIGLECNSRKARRGTAFHGLVINSVNEILDELKSEGIEAECRKEKVVERKGRRKRVDIVIYFKKVFGKSINSIKPRIIIEVNFYSTTGSKPTETCKRAYTEVRRQFPEIEFILITDGRGWKKMMSDVSKMLNLEFPVWTLKQTIDGRLKQFILNLANKTVK